MVAHEIRIARLGGTGGPAANWVDAREARAAEGGLRAPIHRGAPRPPEPRMPYHVESGQKWIA